MRSVSFVLFFGKLTVVEKVPSAPMAVGVGLPLTCTLRNSGGGTGETVPFTKTVSPVTTVLSLGEVILTPPAAFCTVTVTDRESEPPAFDAVSV
jgi:hypothetical protein